MENKNTKDEKETCGIIMPISANENYTAEHWADVKILLEEVINDAGFDANLVSDADEIGIIHNRIVSNVYNNPIIVCDVSSKNPNVMFELGLRLAFDKATIIIKDDATNYNFDTAPIEHLTYPRDLRYTTINKFKSKLKEKLISTYKISQKPEYSTFLKNFVQYKPKLREEEIGTQEFIIKELENINKNISELKQKSTNADSPVLNPSNINGIVTPKGLINKLVAKEFDKFVSERPVSYFSKKPFKVIFDEFMDFMREQHHINISNDSVIKAAQIKITEFFTSHTTTDF